MSEEMSLIRRRRAGPAPWHALTLAMLATGLVHGALHGVLPSALLGCVAAGLLSGALAGVLGLGGGFIFVPVTVWLLPESIAPSALRPSMAIATSLAAMIPAGLAAWLAQWPQDSVERAWFGRLLPGICFGAALGAVLLPVIGPALGAGVVALYAAYLSARLMLAPRGVELPIPWVQWPAGAVAAVTGFVGVFTGGSGSILTVPYLESHQMRVPAAIGMSIRLSFGLSVAAIAALEVRGLWAGTATLVWWPGAAVLGAAAVLTGPLGVRIAQRLDVHAFQRALAWLLLMVAVGSTCKALRF